MAFVFAKMHIGCLTMNVFIVPLLVVRIANQAASASYVLNKMDFNQLQLMTLNVHAFQIIVFKVNN